MPNALILLMSLKPVLTETRISNQGHAEREGMLHLFQNDSFYQLLFLRIDGEVEFVVYLQNHLRTDTLGLLP